MNFTQSISKCFQKYFDFKGRASKSECWFFILFFVLYAFVIGLVVGFSGVDKETADIVILFLILPILPPYFAVIARRLHDFNHSGWMQLIFFPGYIADEFLGTGYILWLITFVLFAFYISQKPSSRKNRFGLPTKK